MYLYTSNCEYVDKKYKRGLEEEKPYLLPFMENSSHLFMFALFPHHHRGHQNIYIHMYIVRIPRPADPRTMIEKGLTTATEVLHPPPDMHVGQGVRSAIIHYIV